MTTVEILCLAVLNIGMPKAHFACDQMETITRAAEHNDLAAEVIIALIHYESNWNPTVVSSANACGLMQVIPRYMKKPGKTCKQLKNPDTNIEVGTIILRRWIERYGKGSLARGLCGYSSGYKCGKKYNRKHAGWRYSRKVRKFAKRLMKEVDYLEDCLEYRLKDEIDEYEEHGCGC